MIRLLKLLKEKMFSSTGIAYSRYTGQHVPTSLSSDQVLMEIMTTLSKDGKLQLLEHGILPKDILKAMLESGHIKQIDAAFGNSYYFLAEDFKNEIKKYKFL